MRSMLKDRINRRKEKKYSGFSKNQTTLDKRTSDERQKNTTFVRFVQINTCLTICSL